MSGIQIPEHAREAIAKLATRRRDEERRRREQRRREDARRRAAEARRRKRLLPLAEEIVSWAQTVAATGVLADLGDAGWPVYDSPVGSLGYRRRIALRADGALLITTTTIRGGARQICSRADELVKHVDGHELERLDGAMRSGSIWATIAE